MASRENRALAHAASQAAEAMRALGETLRPLVEIMAVYEAEEIDGDFERWWRLVGHETGVERPWARLIYGEGWRAAEERQEPLRG